MIVPRAFATRRALHRHCGLAGIRTPARRHARLALRERLLQRRARSRLRAQWQRRVRRVIAKYKATAVRCQSRAGLNPMSKAVMYSTARVVDAKHYLCLDADMVVLGDLRPIFATLEALPEGRILACREGNSHRRQSSWFRDRYGSTAAGEADLTKLGVTPEEQAYSLVVNDGLFAGDQSALLALDGAIRAMPQAVRGLTGTAR